MSGGPEREGDPRPASAAKPSPGVPAAADADAKRRASQSSGGAANATMIPARGRRSRLESIFVRLVATGGIVAIGVVLGAILVSQDVQGWIVGLAISTVTVVLAAILWSSRQT
jgi:hypothetical protein